MVRMNGANNPQVQRSTFSKGFLLRDASHLVVQGGLRGPWGPYKMARKSRSTGVISHSGISGVIRASIPIYMLEVLNNHTKNVGLWFHPGCSAISRVPRVNHPGTLPIEASRLAWLQLLGHKKRVDFVYPHHNWDDLHRLKCHFSCH